MGGQWIAFLGLEQNFRALEMHQFWIVGGIDVSGGKVDADCVFDYPLVIHHCFLEGEAAERANLLFLD